MAASYTTQDEVMAQLDHREQGGYKRQQLEQALIELGVEDAHISELANALRQLNHSL